MLYGKEVTLAKARDVSCSQQRSKEVGFESVGSRSERLSGSRIAVIEQSRCFHKESVEQWIDRLTQASRSPSMDREGASTFPGNGGRSMQSTRPVGEQSRVLPASRSLSSLSLSQRRLLLGSMPIRRVEPSSQCPAKAALHMGPRKIPPRPSD